MKINEFNCIILTSTVFFNSTLYKNIVTMVHMTKIDFLVQQIAL